MSQIAEFANGNKLTNQAIFAGGLGDDTGGGINTQTLGAAAVLTLTRTSAPIQIITCDAGGNDIILPAEETALGLSFYIWNVAGGGVATVKNDAAGTIDTQAVSEAQVYKCAKVAGVPTWVRLGIVSVA